LLGREQMLFRLRELNAEDKSLDAAKDEKGERRHEIADANFLVVDR
jgi:hypothetical protein